MVAVGCVAAFVSASGSADWISTRVGSSSPSMAGSAGPLTFGSSEIAIELPA